MKNLIIRRETRKDYHNTELMTMRAFWNIHGPGCNEHLMVHKLRGADEYLPELSRIAELDGRIVGAIFYSEAKVVDGDKVSKVLTFGPLSVEPTCFSIDDTFSDIVELECRCKFSNCRHETEPGCAIKAVIESGELSPERYALYKNLGLENTNNYARKKEISRWAKAYKKNKIR